MGFDPNMLLGAFIAVFIAVIGFFLKREREFGVLEGRQKAAHKRLDSMEKRIDKIINGDEESED